MLYTCFKFRLPIENAYILWETLDSCFYQFFCWIFRKQIIVVMIKDVCCCLEFLRHLFKSKTLLTIIEVQKVKISLYNKIYELIFQFWTQYTISPVRSQIEPVDISELKFTGKYAIILILYVDMRWLSFGLNGLKVLWLEC